MEYLYIHMFTLAIGSLPWAEICMLILLLVQLAVFILNSRDIYRHLVLSVYGIDALAYYLLKSTWSSRLLIVSVYVALLSGLGVAVKVIHNILTPWFTSDSLLPEAGLWMVNLYLSGTALLLLTFTLISFSICLYKRNQEHNHEFAVIV